MTTKPLKTPEKKANELIFNQNSIPERALSTRIQQAVKTNGDSKTNEVNTSRRKFLGTVATMAGVALLATAIPRPLLAMAQDEKGMAKNEASAPASANAPAAVNAPVKETLNAYPVIGGTTFVMGNSINDSNSFDVTNQLKELGVDVFTEGSFGVCVLVKRGTITYGKEPFASLYLIVPGAKGIVFLDLDTVEKGAIGVVRFSDAMKAIPPTAKYGRDYTVELSRNGNKEIYFDFKVGSKYVASYGFDMTTGEVFKTPIPGSLGQKVGQN